MSIKAALCKMLGIRTEQEKQYSLKRFGSESVDIYSERGEFLLFEDGRDASAKSNRIAYATIMDTELGFIIIVVPEGYTPAVAERIKDYVNSMVTAPISQTPLPKFRVVPTSAKLLTADFQSTIRERARKDFSRWRRSLRSRSRSKPKIPDENFYRSRPWQDLRYRVLAVYRKCLLCGTRNELQVDHIKPRSKYPELALTFENMQVLCRDCNMGKSNRAEHDFRDSNG